MNYDLENVMVVVPIKEVIIEDLTMENQALMEMVQTVLSFLSQFGVFFIGAYISIKTGDIAPSVILLFVQLMNYIISPLMQIPTSLSKRLACNPIFKKISEIIQTESDSNQGKSIDNINEISNGLQVAVEKTIKVPKCGELLGCAPILITILSFVNF